MFEAIRRNRRGAGVVDPSPGSAARGGLADSATGARRAAVYRAAAQPPGPAGAYRPGPPRSGGRLVHQPRRLPKALEPEDVAAFVAGLRTFRDRAITLVMLLGGLRAAEVRSLRLADVDMGLRRVRVMGKGGKERVVPVDVVFFAELAAYLREERPASCRTAECFVVLRGPTAGLRRIFRTHRLASGALRVRPHRLRHTYGTELDRRGVASDATFRARREDGAVRGGCPGPAGRRSRRQSEPPGQDGRDRSVLRQMPGCCVHCGCIRRKHDAAKATKKRSDEGRCHYRPVVTLTHSAWLVNRSLPVSTRACPCKR